MKKILGKISLLLAISTTFVACGDDRSAEFLELTKENRWTYEKMKEVYLWKDSIKEPTQSRYFSVPDQFFKQLLYKSDKSSHMGEGITENTTSGFTFTLMRDPLGISPARVYALIENVEPLSAAAVAGLERGMYISMIDDTKLNMGIGELLIDASARKLSLCKIAFDDTTEEYSWEELPDVVIGPSQSFTPTALPVVTTLQSTNGNIGYILCNNFDDATVSTMVGNALQTFASNDVKHVVLDLRDNNSYTLENIVSVSSMFIPADKQGEKFCTLYKTINLTEKEELYFAPEQTTSCNVPLYIITTEKTQGTANALVSALRITRGSTDVKIIGARAQSNNLYTESIESPYDFVINPVTSIIYDANNTPLTPLAPDYEVDEFADLKNIYPLGSRQEKILSSIVYIIENGALPQQ